MFYVVNKLVGAVLSPLAIGIGLMAVSVLLAAPPNGGGRRNLKWWGMGVGVFAVLWFWVWGTQVMMTIFALPLETDFPVVKAEDSPVADAIVVLGGGMGANSNNYPYAEMWSGADRVWHAARLFKAGKAPVVIPTGMGEETERKAVDVMAEAFRRVHDESPCVRFLVVGDGPMRSLLADQEGVELVGGIAQEEVYANVARGHVMLLVSRYDPWGVSLMEGAMCSQAMIGSDQTGAAKDLIVDGVNGFLVKTGDADSLTEAMRRYARDPALAERHGQSARRTVEQTSGAEAARRILAKLGGRV